MLECTARMEAYNFFLDKDGHLRSGWRLAIFAIAFLICVQVTQIVLFLVLSAALHRSHNELINGYWAIAAGHGSILFSGLVVGWGCGALLEELPFRALGCAPHRGWLKNFAIGSGLGTASLLLAAFFATVTRGIHFNFDPAGAWRIGQTLAVSLLVFVFAAAA
ncbi:MAG TPA: hypothetical protein VLN44_04505, partial [Pyrinomonadaceae bacterium]|nr:hypothetical protein [Pyrinomonadaceae bacterium]